jgi:uncharacterized membrane protein YoaK (UPF0700 family)
VTLSQPSLRRIVLWNLLAFQAGSLNVGGFMACHKFVSHVTGFSTLFGAEIAKGNISLAGQFLLVPLFFMAGSLISGVLIDSRTLEGKEPKYSIVFAILTLSTALILGLGASHVFGKFGMTADMEKDFFLLALLCFSCGLQNATVTSAYGAVVRTTHLTGLTTDLGVGLAKIINPRLDLNKRKMEIRAMLMRAGIIGSFTLGSLICGVIFVKTYYWGFAIPFLISVGLLIFSLALKSKTL